jgi:hypothetical protein
MVNLRILDINPADSQTIKARFSDSLAVDLGQSNVSVLSEETGVPDCLVRSVDIYNDIITINVLPMTPYSRYKVVFQSTNSIRFRNSTSTSYLLEDGTANVKKIIGAEDPTNQTRDFLMTTLGSTDGVYDLSRETIVRTILNGVSETVNKARADVRQSKYDNYLSVLVKDEQKKRGFGPWDRLNQEGAYEIVRVGLTPTNTTVPGEIPYTYFPYDPVSLQQTLIASETLAAGNSDVLSTYNSLLLTLAKTPVIKVNSITIYYEAGGTYTYNIEQFGYRIADNLYDSTYARNLLTLESNQIQLNDALLDDPTFIVPSGLDTIVISYYYKNLGLIIDEDSVAVTQVISVVREPAPALATLFSLPNAPVVTASDAIATSNGITFLDPYSATPFLTTHPAFLYEKAFREDGLPQRAGEFSVDYNTGRVYVYGAVNNDGTGDFPPAMTYYYRKSYVSRLDYTYVADTYNLVASPLRDLSNTASKISFNFELTLVPDQDYVANVHEESRNERIGNRLAALNALNTNHSPVTNVFRIYNETTGELYKPIRFLKNKVYFSYSNAPKIQDFNRERAAFTDVFNEPLILSDEFYNALGTRIFKFALVNQNIISATEDCIGSSFNSSVAFSRSNDIFNLELYYDDQQLTQTQNTDRLLQNQYQVNYMDGIVYVGVSYSTLTNVGTVSYKKASIAPINPHVISVSNVYYSLGNSGVDKTLDYTGFSDGAIDILPADLDIADERFLNGVVTNPYIVYSNTITVSHDIKSLRGVYDVYDLNNNTSPINFAEEATFENNVITLTGGIEQVTNSLTVGVSLDVTVPTISAGIYLYSAVSVVRQSDQVQLLNGTESLVGNSIILGVTSGASSGDIVDVIYKVALNGGATPVVDYNRGEFYFDYTALTDEILVTYEWGDNVIDYRQSLSLNENDIYYVTYKVGAMRDALLNNFGTLVQIPELQAFDEDIDRELYRDILTGALQTFTKGPTIPALKQLVASVTKIDPKITEALFNSWTLDSSYLGKLPATVLGSPQFVSGRFGQGLQISNVEEGVSLPVSNNLRIEEGTLELFITPAWNGLDNDATLTFTNIAQDGYNLLPTSIFIGSTSYNPVITDGSFTVSRTDNNAAPVGIPGRIYTDVGVFIYYDPDNKQWKVLGKSSTSTTAIYTGTIQSSGKVYDVKFISGLGEVSDILRSGSSAIEFAFNLDGYDAISPDGYYFADGYVPGYSFDGLQFMADDNHYIYDFGREANKDRFSLYKDGRGYLVFEVWDKGGFGELKPKRRSVYQVSADISNWIAGQTHHVAISWILNSSDKKDEMHLFVDGLEVPNIAKYGNIPSVASTNRFRTIIPEQVIAVATKTSIAGYDLQTTQSSFTVTSATVDFSAMGIVPGDTIEVLEQGYSTYTIATVSGNTLVLTSSMPATLADARFSVNPVDAIVQTEIDIYTKIAVYIKHSGTGAEIEIPGESATLPSYSIERNALNQRILRFYGNITVGDSVLLKSFGLNHRRCHEQVYLWSDQSILKTGLPSPVNLDDVSIRAVLLGLTSISPVTASVVGLDFVAAFSTSQPTNAIEGRTLEIRVTGGSNINWLNPVSVVISGTSTGGVTETLTFTGAAKKNTVNKWKTITDITFTVTPLNTTLPSISVEVKELYSVTNPEGNNIYPVIRYAYQSQSGLSLQGTGDDIVFDTTRSFFDSDIGALLQVTSPFAATYEILARIDENTVQVDAAVGSSFTNGAYGVYKINIGRSGFQNGFMFLERAGFNNLPYTLPKGFYEVDYATFLSVRFNPLEQLDMIIGNDRTLQKPVRAVLDEFRILNRQLIDTRIGESVSVGTDTITTNSISFAPFRKSQDSLVLLHFEDPLINDTDYYRFATKEYIQSGSSINSKFGHCLVVKDKGLVFENNGYLTSNTEGMVEFWVSPKFDTYNDPNDRVYFDAAAISVESITSTTKSKVTVASNIRKVISVKISGSDDDYFAGGVIGSDYKTITLNKPLPFQQTPVIVSYVSTGVSGDRILLKKDVDGFLSYTVVAGEEQFQIRYPIFWVADTWHRVRASFKFNTANHQDEMRLFVDGEEKGVLLFGTTGVVFDPTVIFGSGALAVGSKSLIADINFNDDIIQFSLGQDYTGNYGAMARFDNLKMSNKAVNPFIVGGQAKDVYFNTNLEYIYPSIEDTFTTFLFNFDDFVVKIDDFAILRNTVFGLFNFDLDIIDSFNIVKNDEKVKTILLALIDALKPATSKVSIKYY